MVIFGTGNFGSHMGGAHSQDIGQFRDGKLHVHGHFQDGSWMDGHGQTGKARVRVRPILRRELNEWSVSTQEAFWSVQPAYIQGPYEQLGVARCHAM